MLFKVTNYIHCILYLSEYLTKIFIHNTH